MKGSTPEYLEEGRDLHLEQIGQEVKNTRYQLAIGVGTPKKHIVDIYQSFLEALVSIQNSEDQIKNDSKLGVDKTELLKLDKSAVENFVRYGVREDFVKFFDGYIEHVGETALKSYALKNYIFVDVVLAATKLVNELDGEIEDVIPELNSIETILANINTIEQLKEQSYKILSSALAFRDSRANYYTGIIQQAKEFIENHYMESNLSLLNVASQVNLSHSHFSMIFSQETSQTFKDYLTEVRIKKAKELLRSTTLRAADISYQVGYNDPHYFSSTFKKNTGFSPTEFRSQVSA
jgi:two-component system, response regulator YesN